LTEPQNKGLSGWLIGPYQKYLQKLVPIIQLCTMLFIFSLCMGFLLGDRLPLTALQDLFGRFPDISKMDSIDLFGLVFFNNSFNTLLFMIGGIIAGIPSLFFVVFNGFIIGWSSYFGYSIEGIGFVIASLVPHGVIEIPLMIICMSMGMSLGYELLNRVRGRGEFGKEARLAFGLFLTRALPLLVLAAVIEAEVTPFILMQLGYL
jgi:stage II sporulation protein M